MVKVEYFTSESVTEGHPDKICDQISDAVLDELLRQDPDSRVAVETLTTTGTVIVAGEVTTRGFVDVQKIVRLTLKEIGYTDPSYGIDWEDAGVLVSIHGQSPDIAQGVDEGKEKEQGAGDQGCLRKGTLVRTSQGFKRIEDVGIGDFVVTKEGLKKVLQSRNTGVKQIKRVLLSNGMSLDCTADHRILCYSRQGNEYWKAAGDLSHDDFVCILKPVEDFSKTVAVSEASRKEFFTKYNHKIYGPERLELDEGIGYVTGELVGDGWVNSDRTMTLAFGNNFDHVSTVKDLVEAKMPGQWKEIKNGNYAELEVNSVLVRRHFENFGLNRNKAPEKTTPNSIFISPPEVIASYLRGLFDSDGTIVINTGRSKSNAKIRLGSTSIKLLRETQLLLNDFGVKAVILFNSRAGTKIGKGHKYTSKHDSYVLSVIGFDSFQNFSKKIGFIDKTKSVKLSKFVKIQGAKKKNSRGLFVIPHPNKNELIDEKRLGKDLPYSMASVSSVEHAGEDDVYDLEIQDVHLFSGNGFIVHNSMFGYACNETAELMPLPIMIAHNLVMKLSELRKNGRLSYLGPDGKSQVSVEYHDGKPKRIEAVVIAAQHRVDVLEEKLREDIKKLVIEPVCGSLLDANTKYHINATGKFVIGGPEGDTGVTGRKIIVDSYGGMGRHGGGAYSGKDASKVDRSGAYAARYAAKNVVAAGLAEQCEVQVSYAIGVAEPTSINVRCFGTNRIPEEKLAKLVRKHFPLRPKAIIDHLKLKRPIYRKTAAYGHFGRSDPDFTWELTDKADILRKEAGI